MTEYPNKEWFSTWFDSPYYHILYGHRDEDEARNFLDRLTSLPFFKSAKRVADVCCGKGRHATYLHAKGFEVEGFDLSDASIQHCLSMAKPGMRFQVHDIREPFPSNGFDVVLNLFTSFGYFTNDQDHEKALTNMGQALQTEGRLVIDFLNPDHVKSHLVAHESVSKEGLQFIIHRAIEGNRLIKNIAFQHEGQQYDFEENVALISLNDFRRYLAACGMEIVELFGNYELHPYDSVTSPRMILIAQHTHA